MKVIIRRPTVDNAFELSGIICNDGILRNDLGIKKDDYPTPKDFLLKISDWEKKYNSETFAIIAGDNAIGIISLTHIDKINKKARIGYWVGSEFRNKGYCSKGFEELLKIARIKGIESVSSKIAIDNPSSFHIWKKLKAVEKVCEKDKTNYTLQL